MRVLLDECVPRKLAHHLRPHDATTVAKLRLSGVNDQRLLEAAARGFDVVITVDRSLIFQQNLQAIPVSVIVLHAFSNRLADLLPLVPELLQSIERAQPGQAMHIPHAQAP